MLSHIEVHSLSIMIQPYLLIYPDTYTSTVYFIILKIVTIHTFCPHKKSKYTFQIVTWMQSKIENMTCVEVPVGTYAYAHKKKYTLLDDNIR